MSNYLTVISKTIGVDAKNNKVFTFELQSEDKAYKTLPNGKMLELTRKAKIIKFRAMPVNYLNKADFGVNFTVGEVIEGNIITRTVAPYEVVNSDKTYIISEYSCAVFHDTEAPDFEEVVIRTFKENGRPLAGTVVNKPYTFNTSSLNAEKLEAEKLEAEKLEAEKLETERLAAETSKNTENLGTEKGNINTVLSETKDIVQTV